MQKSIRCRAAILAAAAAALNAAPAAAQGAFSLLPQDNGPRTGIFSIFTAPAPPQEADAAPAAPASDDRARWRPVAVPLPPVADKALRRAAAVADERKGVVAASPEPTPAPTGLFSFFTQQPAPQPPTASVADAPWKPVALPLPPVLDPGLRLAAARTDRDRAGKDANAGKASPAAVASTPPGAPKPPQATGLFALFTQPAADGSASGSGEDSSRVVLPSGAASFAPVEGPATRVASLGLPNPLRNLPERPAKPDNDDDDDDLEDEEPGVRGQPGEIEKQIASVRTECLQPELLALVRQAGQHFGGTAVITSGYRPFGRRGSLHRRCSAVDFQIPGVAGSQIVAFLRRLPGAGGVGTYCHTKSVHLDTGEPRDWHQCGFHRRFALRAPLQTAAQ